MCEYVWCVSTYVTLLYAPSGVESVVCVVSLHSHQFVPVCSLYPTMTNVSPFFSSEIHTHTQHSGNAVISVAVAVSFN